MKSITMRDAIKRSVAQEMRKDKDIFMIGEDIGAYGGTLQATYGLIDEFGPERIIDSPLSEYALIGSGIGAAYMGLKPIVEIMFEDFMPLVADQLINNAAKACYLSDGEINCPLVVRAAYGAGSRSGAHHCQSLEGIFMGIPGLKIVIPSNPADASGLMKAAIADPNPVLFFEHKMLYGVRGAVPDEDVTVPLGKASIVREGTDITVVSYGSMVPKAAAAAVRLEEEGISVDLIDLRTIWPLDEEAILQSVKKTGRLLIAQEACTHAGAAGEVAAVVSAGAIEYLDAPIVRLGAPDVAVPFAPTLEDFFIPSAEHIVEEVKRLVGKN